MLTITTTVVATTQDSPRVKRVGYIDRRGNNLTITTGRNRLLTRVRHLLSISRKGQ